MSKTLQTKFLRAEICPHPFLAGVSVSNGWFGSKEDVPKSSWVREMFDKMHSEIQSLAEKLEREISDLSHRQAQDRGVLLCCYAVTKSI